MYTQYSCAWWCMCTFNCSTLPRPLTNPPPLFLFLTQGHPHTSYGMAIISSLLKNICLFCRI